MTELEKIEKEIKAQQKLYNQVFNSAEKFPTLEGYQDALEPFRSRLEKLSQEKRMIMPYKLQDMPDYGDQMSLKDFIACVKDGSFIDYDGSGNYVKDGKMTDIDIYPSDVKGHAIRKDFDTIIWFNR